MATPQESDAHTLRVEKAMLTPLVRHLLHSESVEITNWQSHAIHAGFGGGSLYRLSGNATDGEDQAPWSLILKIFRRDEQNSLPSDARYWRREALAYQSGVLDNLPGHLAAPRCLEVIERTENEIWVWLEEVIEAVDAKWSIEHYIRSARHLGQFNGAYLTGNAIPAEPWVSRNWLRAWITDMKGIFDLLGRSLDHPLVEQLYPGDCPHRLLQMQEEWETFFEVLERLPQTFCHMDAFRRNLFASEDSEGNEKTVAIDWEFTGQGSVGEELAGFVGASLALMEVEMADADKLDEVAFHSYLEGLADAGWHGDSQTVRLGYVVASTLRFTAPIPFSLLLDETRHARLEQTFGRSVEQMIAHWSGLMAFQLQLADEARNLIRIVDNS